MKISKILTAAAFVSLMGAGAASAEDSIDTLIFQIQNNIPSEDVVAAASIDREILDMTGADGTLRACYEKGGMAKQNLDLTYTCNYDAPAPRADGMAPNAPPIRPLDAPTDYEGHANIADQQMLSCVERGGSPVQLTNMNWACSL